METLNRKSKNLTARIYLILSLIFCFWFAAAVSVYAAEEANSVLLTLQKYEIDSSNDVFVMFFRMVGFGVIKILASVVDACYSGLNEICTALDFTYSKELLELNNRYSLLYKMIFTISVAMLGLYLIGRNTSNQLNTVTCIMLIAVIIMGMPIFVQKLSEITKTSATYAQQQWKAEANSLDLGAISGSIVSDYMVDLKKVDENISESNVGKLETAVKNSNGYNNIDKDSKEWRYIEINEVMDFKENSFENDIWNKKLVKGEEGYEEAEIKTGFISFMEPFYYRYQMSSWLQPILLLLILTIILVFTIFRCGCLIVDIGMSQIYLPIIAITDLTYGQRIKEGIKHVFVLFGCIFLCIALIGIYFIGYKWINVHIESGFVKIIFQLALAYKVIDGPDIIERILGVDVGIKDAWKTAVTANQVGGILGKIGKATTTTAKRVNKAGTNAKDKAADGINSMKERKTSANEEAQKWKPVDGNEKSDPMTGKPSDRNGEAANSKGQPEDPMNNKNGDFTNVKAGDTTNTHVDPMSNKNAFSDGKAGNVNINHTEGTVSGNYSQTDPTVNSEIRNNQHIHDDTMIRKNNINRRGGKKDV